MPQEINPLTVTVSSNDVVRAELHGPVLVVTLNRPKMLNAVNVDVARGVGEALEYAEEATAVRAIIITGAGKRAFCAGADLKEAAGGRLLDNGDNRLARWGFAGYVAHAVSKPTIAAVNGFALGGGTEIVLASDLAVAVETARFGLPEVTVGIAAGAGGAFRLPRQIPRKIAMQAILTGQPITAVNAHLLGLVNRIVPASELMASAFELADQICQNAPLAVQASKRIAAGITDQHIADESEDWVRTLTETERLIRSSDAIEGMKAFAEKRAPQWRGQ